MHPDGRVDVVIGTVSTGQGHETSFAQLVTEWLGVPIEKVRDHHRRHRHREGRRRHAFRPRHAPGQHRHLERVEQDHRERQAHRRAAAASASRAACRIRRRPRSSARRPRALDRSCGGRPAAIERAAPTCPTICAARSRPYRDETINGASFPVRLPRLRGRDRSRDRHGRRSCATPRSTTSAARSIR